eukprot:12331152-Heterocapsa_arctica.AAC.1
METERTPSVRKRSWMSCGTPFSARMKAKSGSISGTAIGESREPFQTLPAPPCRLGVPARSP